MGVISWSLYLKQLFIFVSVFQMVLFFNLFPLMYLLTLLLFTCYICCYYYLSTFMYLFNLALGILLGVGQLFLAHLLFPWRLLDLGAVSWMADRSSNGGVICSAAAFATFGFCCYLKTKVKLEISAFPFCHPPSRPRDSWLFLSLNAWHKLAKFITHKSSTSNPTTFLFVILNANFIQWLKSHCSLPE